MLNVIAKYPFDSDVPLVELPNAAVSLPAFNVLSVSELSAAQVGSWANAVECREDIELAQGIPLAREAIRELANPAQHTATHPTSTRSMVAVAPTWRLTS